MSAKKNLSPVERIKLASDGLRGTLAGSLQDGLTGALHEDDQTLIKFHGMYQQDDRDRRAERSAKKLEWLFSYMIRLRLPGGYLTPEQWTGLHHIAGEFSTGVIKITTRQTVQLHGILKSSIKPTIHSFNTLHLDSIAACGDVNRNVTCSAHPKQSAIHDQVFRYADLISELALPKTNAYYEIWLDQEKIADKKAEEDPLYQDRYLPRKFKIAIAIPPNNDVDVFSNDIGLIAIIENNELKGFNIVAGGGLSSTHGNAQTYARTASMLGFVDTEEKIKKAVYEIITIQRDFGNRSDRKLARLKYTIDQMGVDGLKTELEKRCGFQLQPARPYAFTERKDYYGWEQDHTGNWHYTLFVENGRIVDEVSPLKSGLFAVAASGKANFRFTANQNVIVSDVSPADYEAVNSILEEYKLIAHTDNAGAMRKNAMACVAFNTCPLALAEAQRYLPTLIDKIEPLLARHSISEEEITVRMTGCPNGCGRSPLAEIGFVGTGYGEYNLHIGGDRLGERLNIKYKDSLDESAILLELDDLFGRYKAKRELNETFGDFVMREKLV
ncbi:MAG: NADPH-dependent assimilatory sulfite reductase hemoprotein subunit [Chitinophagaceae bacterium]|nr:MAG: NADPH-dependent assimilatory sulfite reductase hemoprotein subunit [Chitinophagaceae bacterium]